MIFVTCYVSQFTVEDSFYMRSMRWCTIILFVLIILNVNTWELKKFWYRRNYLSNLWLHSLGKITLELHSINDKCLIRFSLIVVEKMFFETCLLTMMEIYSRRPRMIYTSYLGRADRIINRPTTITKG